MVLFGSSFYLGFSGDDNSTVEYVRDTEQTKCQYQTGCWYGSCFRYCGAGKPLWCYTTKGKKDPEKRERIPCSSDSQCSSNFGCLDCESVAYLKNTFTCGI